MGLFSSQGLLQNNIFIVKPSHFRVDLQSGNIVKQTGKMPLDFIASERGRDLLVHDGFVYRQERATDSKTIWKCVQNHAKKCAGRCHTSDGTIIKSSDNHNHVPDRARIEARKVVQRAKIEALSTTSSTQQILASISESASPATAGKLPHVGLLKRTIQRTRQQAGAAPPVPLSLRDLMIPEQYARTIQEEDFLLFDSGAAEDRLLIFSTQRNLQLLRDSPHWYADGTFKVVPPLFDQLYTIHSVKFYNTLPLVFALMPNREALTYMRVFDALKELQPGFSPVSVLVDFEKAAINSFEQSFPEVEVRGCFFHFSQCVWRRVQGDRDLLERYINDADFALGVKMIAALAFVPEENVVVSFGELLTFEFFMQNEAILQDLLNYFETTWIGRLQRGRRRAPIFPLRLWNCYRATAEGLPRTNNAVEGWHQGFNSLLLAAHPTIWKFVNALKKEQSLNEMKINQYLAGERPPQARKKYRDCGERIRKVVTEYGIRPLEEYLRGIAHNLEYSV